MKSNITNLDARNSQVIRNHLIELCVILCCCKKTKVVNLSKISDSDFNTKTLVTVMAKNNEIGSYIKKMILQTFKL